jgi:hypothetical protein
MLLHASSSQPAAAAALATAAEAHWQHLAPAAQLTEPWQLPSLRGCSSPLHWHGPQRQPAAATAAAAAAAGSMDQNFNLLNNGCANDAWGQHRSMSVL